VVVLRVNCFAPITFTIVCLMILTTTKADAQSCANPGGSYNSANGSQYEFVDATNNYAMCLLAIAPTSTPSPTPTPAPTPTLAATPQAILTQTGCNAYGADPNTYQNCITTDAEVRSNAYVFWTIPLILVAIIAFGVTSRGRFVGDE
jgi:hypothetical protein